MPDCPILVWMLALNREYTKDEYDACYRLVKECVPHASHINYKYDDANSFRELITYMLPLLMMRHRRIPRAKWRDQVTSNGKRWIEQTDLPPDRFLGTMIGYYLVYEGSLCGMAMTQGFREKVVNIGLGIKQIPKASKAITTKAIVESMAHKLTDEEIKLIWAEEKDEVVLRRLCVTLSLKESYIHAIGQPIGFDYRRLNVNAPAQQVLVDNIRLEGWEFRIFQVKLGVARGMKIKEEDYQCVCAFFRGGSDTKFLWDTAPRMSLDSWVQFINIDQMIKVIPKLSA
ncbi:hypothetical protein AX16_004905 [Volvariella volvacea WC 439]|nr:hypothetical protein AX16_004905 [Volvariella volvacea WC 439]